MEIRYTSKFERAFRKLPREIQTIAVEREVIFRSNFSDPRLHTHKLKGELGKYWSFSIDYSYRVLFEKDSDGNVIFLNIGDHDIYR